ncbi:MAG: VIT family protein [Acidimicrobiales bacterium]
MARHSERHLTHRTGWIRAAVLGANDGIISTAALILGVAAAGADRSAVLTAGVAGLTAGALSMALGEYVSVSSQRDTENADIAKEKWELENVPERELAELTAIYQEKGLKHDLARAVAVELTAHNALGTHLNEELGITESTRARPWQAAWSSLAAFAIGALLPLLAATFAANDARIVTTLLASVLALVGLGYAGARAGGAKPARPMLRVVGGGILAMAATMVIGELFGSAIG